MERLNKYIEKTKDIYAYFDGDSDNEFEYDDYILNMQYAPIKSSKGFFIVGENLDWRGSSGHALATDLRDVANKILMHDGRCTTRVWKGDDRNTLEAVSYHHDCPTGSWFKIMSTSRAKKLNFV